MSEQEHEGSRSEEAEALSEVPEKAVPKGISRKEFLKRTGLLGVTIGAGSLLAACTNLDGNDAETPEGTDDTQASGNGAGSGLSGDSAYDEAVREVVNGRTLSVAFTPPALSEFYDEIEHGAWHEMAQYEARFGIQWEWTKSSPAEHEQVENQQDTIRDWVSQGMDAILVCTAGDFVSMQRLYATAQEQGTEIFQFNMPMELWDVGEVNARSNIGYDNARQAGEIAGRYIAERLNGEGTILQVWGVPTHWSESREVGLLRALEDYPGIEIVGKERGDYVRDMGMAAAENLLERFPDADAIYGENEEMALGAAQAAAARGLEVRGEGDEGVLIIGADGLQSGYEEIREGRMTATVDVGPVDQGRLLVRNLFDSLVLGRTIDRVTEVSTMVVDNTNAGPSSAYVDWALDGPEY